jgi:hypothetical protein
VNRLTILLVLACALMVAAPARAALADTLVVGFDDGVSAKRVERIARAHGARYTELGSPTVIELDGLQASLDSVKDDLLHNPHVRFVERVNTVKGAAATPFPEQWGLDNTGQYNGTKGADIDVKRAWDVAGYGENVLIGTIDSGVKFGLPGLSGLKLWTNPGENGRDAQGRDKSTNAIDDDNNGCTDDSHGCDFVDMDGLPDDGNGHGTAVTSVIAGSFGGPVMGVAPNVTYIAARALDQYASGTTAMEAAAINYLGRAGARIINISISGPDSLAVRNAIAAWPNTLFIVAAGNSTLDDDGPQGQFPCSDPAANIVCVAASTPSDTLASFSNFGALRVDFAAPGQKVSALRLDGSQGFFNGTSFAAPMVSGIAALMVDANPNATVADLKDALKNSVEVKPAFSKIRTSGRVNAYNAVQLVQGKVPAPRPSAAKPVPPAPAPTPVTPAPAPEVPPATTSAGPGLTTSSTLLPSTIDVLSTATRKGTALKVTLKCVGGSECDGDAAAVVKGAKRTPFVIKAATTYTLSLKAKLAKKTKKAAIAVTTSGTTVRHVVKVK